MRRPDTKNEAEKNLETLSEDGDILVKFI